MAEHARARSARPSFDVTGCEDDGSIAACDEARRAAQKARRAEEEKARRAQPAGPEHLIGCPHISKECLENPLTCGK